MVVKKKILFMRHGFSDYNQVLSCFKDFPFTYKAYFKLSKKDFIFDSELSF